MRCCYFLSPFLPAIKLLHGLQILQNLYNQMWKFKEENPIGNEHLYAEHLSHLIKVPNNYRWEQRAFPCQNDLLRVFIFGQESRRAAGDTVLGKHLDVTFRK